MNKIINCLEYETVLNNLLKQKIIKLKANYNVFPKLATILVGENPASHIYINAKTIKAKKLGIEVENHFLSENIEEKTLLELIENLNKDKSISGILVQMPLPKNIDTNNVINTISHKKDVDGLTPYNVGLLASEGFNPIIPCTALGVLYTLKQQTPLIGKRAIVIGKSRLVGLPTSLLLLQNQATVTIAHSSTKNLADLSIACDIVVVAIGSPRFIKKTYIKKDAIVIDVGINRIIENNINKIVGDVDTNNVLDTVSLITSVPNGIGKLTTTFLMYNTYKTCLIQNKIFDDSYDIFL